MLAQLCDREYTTEGIADWRQCLACLTGAKTPAVWVSATQRSNNQLTVSTAHRKVVCWSRCRSHPIQFRPVHRRDCPKRYPRRGNSFPRSMGRDHRYPLFDNAPDRQSAFARFLPPPSLCLLGSRWTHVDLHYYRSRVALVPRSTRKQGQVSQGHASVVRQHRGVQLRRGIQYHSKDAGS